MKKICIVTPDCGDRPELLEHCQYQAAKQTVKVPHIVLSKKPENNIPDLTQKIRMACGIALQRGFEYIAIMENDDYYPNTWLEEIISHDFDLLGIESTYYYNLAFRKWSLFEHESRSSLFCTAFRIDALVNYTWPPDDEIYLDVHLWKHFNIQLTPESITANCKLITPNEMPIGIKHNIGLVGGIGHANKDIFENDDSKLEWLAANIKRPDSFAFYAKLAEELHYKQLGLTKL